MRHSSKNFLTIEQERYYEARYREEKFGELHSLLLDSSLISPTQLHYTMKVIECGKYTQFYYFNKEKVKKEKKKKDIDIDNLYKNEITISKRNDLKIIEYKNIMRSKFQLQRLVKSNEDIFKTFITLTFADNITSIEQANKKFDIWRTKIKSIYKDFKYVCVPEFQKRGAVHYHLLTNIEIQKEYSYIRRNKQNETQLIIPQKEFSDKQLLKMTLKQREHCYDVKFWSYGLTSIFPMKNINVVGYITKYMTKDIDNRLFGKRRYFNSQNLIIPRIHFVDMTSDFEFLYLLEKQNNSTKVYEGSYFSYDNDVIDFVEFKEE